jgi:hypothetical protein
MVFLTTEDFKQHIKDEILASITGNDFSLLDSAELRAIAQMTDALSVRYDVPNIFNKAGAARNQGVVMRLVDMVLYHLHSRINPGQVPQLRAERYTDCLEWLRFVAAGKFMPDLPLPAGASEGTKLDVQYGGRTARDPYF